MDTREVIDGDGPRTVHLSGHCGSPVIDYSGEDFDFEQDHAPTYSVSFALRRQPVGIRHRLVPVVIRSPTDMQSTREGQRRWICTSGSCSGMVRDFEGNG